MVVYGDVFFFSSRRRHTRCLSDWSSDVCSSDLRGLQTREGEPIPKSRLSSDCTLQLECMKSESLVIADQHAAVNTFPGLVHTARHIMGVGFPRRRCANRKEAGDHCRVSNWDEVVTR